MAFENPIQSTLGTSSFAAYEEKTYAKHQENAEKEIVETVQNLFSNLSFMMILKQWAGAQGFHLHGWRKVGVRFKSGVKRDILSPVFLKAKPKNPGRGRKPGRRKRTLRHLGLELLGIFERRSPALIRLCVHMAALSPSFEVAALALRNFGVTVDANLLRSLVYRFGEAAIKRRIRCHADPGWNQPGLRVQVCVDAGRTRERRKKRGKREKGGKRQGFHTDWTAPWLLTINVFDENGKKVKSIPPIVDGSCGDIDKLFDLLRRHLEAINLAEVAEIVLCADGGIGIWPRFEALADELELKNPEFVLDYTHAKQNMVEVTDAIIEAMKLGKTKANRLRERVGEMLWHGDIEAIEQLVEKNMKGTRSRKKALKKLKEYFGDHSKFQYETLKNRNIPVGSGAVESAIRRVINLRIKSPGMFWKKENIELMIFLRSLVLTGKLRNAFEVTCETPLIMLSENRLSECPVAA